MQIQNKGGLSMKKTSQLIISLLALGMLGLTAWGCGTAAAADDGPSVVYVTGQNTGISVSGVGKLTATADVAVVSLGVQAEAQTAALAQQIAAQAMTEVLDSLKAGGVADKDIATNGYSIYPVYRYDYGMSTIIGYSASNYVTVKVRNVENTGKVIDAAVVAGGNVVRVNNVYFTLDNPAQYDGAARDLAMADALARAEQLASLGGVKLGKPVYITEYGGFGYYQPPVAYDLVGEAANARAETPISPNEIELSLSVQVVYSIQ